MSFLFLVGAGGFERPKIMFQKMAALFWPHYSCNLPKRFRLFR